MAVLNVVKVGHPVLKQKAAPVEFVNKKIRALLDDMKDTMYAEDGVGLAAPQVGESIRMLVSIGLGWSVLPKTLLNQDLKQLDVPLEMTRKLGMVWHPGRTQSKAAEALVQYMKQQ